MPTGNPYPFVTVADRIPNTSFKSKYYMYVLEKQYRSHPGWGNGGFGGLTPFEKLMTHNSLLS